MVGCQGKEALTELEALKAQAEVEVQNKELLRDYFAEVVKGNIDIVLKVCAEDALFYFPSNNPNPITRDQMLEGVKDTHRAFSDINYKIEDMIAEGDKVLVRFVNQSTHSGEIEGIPVISLFETKLDIRIWKGNKVYGLEENEDGFMVIKRYRVSWGN
jgi:ketosteroid isomerase-like protein